MNTDVAPDATARSRANAKSSPASLWIRRVHMYLGLFFAPWMLMYALSTLVMTHRDWVASFYASKTPALTLERELDYSRRFPPDAKPAQMADQILQDLGLAGASRVTGGTGGKPLQIERQHALGTRRITFDPTSSRITVQREEFRGPTFLERMHRRRGFQQPHAVDDAWGLSVDVAMITMVIWGLSGLWLWWELRQTRLGGACCIAAGLALFAVFAATI